MSAGTQVRRTVAHKHLGARFHSQSVTLSYDNGVSEYGTRLSAPRWVVGAWDYWSHRTLAEAKAHFRSIGAPRAA